MTILIPETRKDMIALSEAPKSIRDFMMAAVDFEEALNERKAAPGNDAQLSETFDRMTRMVEYVGFAVGGWNGEVSEEEFAGIKETQAAYQVQYRKVLGLEVTN